jgi:hypothetical protein
MRLLFALSALLLAPQTIDELEPHNVKLAAVEYRGRPAIQIVADATARNGESYAIVKDTAFHNGTIQVDLAGKPAEGAGAGARGFIGIAFRLKEKQYEYIYLRPTNGRAPDQVRRNHSTQYGAHPNYDFARLRKDSPERYESYVDLEPGVWTRYKIVVDGVKARLFVHDAEQPCLIVDDLKLGDSEGGVALWVGPGTEGYFANLKISR